MGKRETKSAGKDGKAQVRRTTVPLAPTRADHASTPDGASANGTRKRTRADHVVHEVRDYIYRNGLKPGDLLPGEYELARQLNVSRPTLREAIKGLAVSGLLEARPRTGTRVREFAYEQIVEALVAHFCLSDVGLREILEARAALEMAALPLVIERVTSEQVVKMRRIEERFERVTNENGNHIELDLELHAAFLSATGNRLLASMVGLLRAFFAHPSLEESILERHYDRAEQERTINEHRLLIEAFAAGDAEVAMRTLSEHFDRQLRWLEQPETVD